jgi:hypothetical protein
VRSRQAREIRLRAERKCGEMLNEREMAKQRSQRSTPVETLTDLGITRDQSSQWQLAAVPPDIFEAALVEPGSPPSTSGIIARHDAATRPLAPAVDIHPATLSARNSYSTASASSVTLVSPSGWHAARRLHLAACPRSDSPSRKSESELRKD